MSKKEKTYYEIAREKGYSRRDFMKLSAMMAAMLGLETSAVGKIANALKTKQRLPVVWLHGQECTCCSESFIRTSHPMVADILLDRISLNYTETLMAPAGYQAEKSLQDTLKNYYGRYLLAVEGSIPYGDNGVYCCIAGKSFEHIVNEVADGAKAIIAWGNCASAGCVQAAKPNPTGATPIHKVIKGKPIINVQGCPPIGEVMAGVIVQMLTFGQLPELDQFRRPKSFYSKRVHDSCYRRPNFDAGLFVEAFDDENAKKGYCLYKVAHYLEALAWQREIVKVHTIFGGKNPHPNYLVGGVPLSVNLNGSNALNSERLAYVRLLLDEAKTFIDQVYIPDLLTIASFYKNWGAIGGGLDNYLVYGDLPTNGFKDVTSFKFPRGIILGRDLNKIHEVDASDPDQIKEYIAHSYYNYNTGNNSGKHPWQGETILNYTGPQPPYDQLDVKNKYSWLKTPRWKGYPMEVGPLSRMLVGYASGRKDYQGIVNATLKKLNVPVTALFSTLGRTAARGLETQLVSNWALEFFDSLINNIKNGDSKMHTNYRWDPKTWPKETKGVGMSEAPRGALAHWIHIKDQAIENYQLVVPSTWNGSPRDQKGQRSAYEASLIGTPVANPEEPLELLRTIHSFDPCIACAVHMYDEKGSYVHQVQTF